MRDQKLKLEDLKASHTIGGAGEGDPMCLSETLLKELPL